MASEIFNAGIYNIIQIIFINGNYKKTSGPQDYRFCSKNFKIYTKLLI